VAAVASEPKPAEITRALVSWYRRQKRDLPWRGAAPDPYGIWVCEIMAQQTQIATVARYWTRWMARFPTPAALAAAPLDDVLALWAGLGYYARARSLHRAAQEIVARHGGRVPDDPEALLALPGIGRYTAGAIASIAFARRVAAVDGNVSRVLARVFGLADDVRSPPGVARLWQLAETLVPARAPGDFNQALFDLGATVCTPRSPACLVCPLAAVCVARASGRQEELPVLLRRTVVKEVRVEAALVVRADGAWLLARRAPSGLYGGLWELPELAALEAAGSRPRADRARALAEHVHKLSHRTMHHAVYATSLGAAPAAAAPYDATRFAAPAELVDLGVSSATRALVAKLRRAPVTSQGAENDPWPTKKKPGSSSSRATRRSSPA
jgi:A/G-specific adenine glycosylase